MISDCRELSRIATGLKAVLDRGWVKAQNLRRSDNRSAYLYKLTPSAHSLPVHTSSARGLAETSTPWSNPRSNGELTGRRTRFKGVTVLAVACQEP